MRPQQVKQSPDEVVLLGVRCAMSAGIAHNGGLPPQVRLGVRFRVRPRVRLRGRFGVLGLSAPWRAFGCSGALFAGGCVCENSMSVVSCASGCLALRGLRLCAGGAVACSLCRRPIDAVPVDAGALLVALLVTVTAGGSVVSAYRVVASRRLLLTFARLRRPRRCSAESCGSATVSWSYTAPPTLSRRMAGRWENGRRAPGRRGGGGGR